MALLQRGLERVFSGLISVKLWVFAIAAGLLIEFALFYPEPTGWIKGVFLLAGLVGFVGLLVTQWMMTRALGRATKDEVGSVISWIAWSLMAYLPALILLIGSMVIWGLDEFDARMDAAPWWLVSVVMSVTAALIVPVSVHAVGRAIDAAGPSLRDCFRACRPVYLPLAFSFLVVLGASFLASDWFTQITPAGEFGFSAILSAIASSLLVLVSSVWLTAMLTLVWRTVIKSEQA